MEVINLDDLLKNLALILLFINIVLFAFSYLKSNEKNKAFKYFLIYLILTFCVMIASFIVPNLQKKLNVEQNNLFLSHFYFVFQFVFLSLFYSTLFTKRQIKYQINISVVVFLILILQYAFYPNLFYRFNLLEIFITSFPLIIYSIVHLYNSLSKPGKFMYVNAGVLIYLSTSTLIFILGDYLSKINIEIASDAWFINRMFYVGYLILILIEWKRSLLKTKN